ncbi:hypothetical protein ACLHDD_02320 [Pantoea sp. NSTU24]|uniref:glycine-rich domain-containing protein n=1 Tax=Pantoea sp. NSTU24 TaxID=3391144 RepID=UPI003CFE6838
MQNSSQPKLLPVPFADAGSKQDIPNDSQIGVTAGRASYTDGFPPLTRTPLAAGGVPPFGTDFNGVLNDVTAAVRWSQAGAGYPFNTAFNTAIGGYPKGARIPNSTLDGFWLNTTDSNSTNPENTTSALTGWVPSGFYGTTAITGLSGSSVTLTTLQAGRDRITLAGTLTSNINLIVPAWVKRWEIVNNCTGSFSVTVKTPNGSGVSVAAGISAFVYGDGTNINQAASPGSLINAQVFTGSGSYTPTAGTKKIIVEVQAGGGAGGGTPATSSSQNSVASGGSSGQYVKSQLQISSLSLPVTVTVGIGGSGVAGSGGSGGGASMFGPYMTASGGFGGGVGSAASSAYVIQPGSVRSLPTTGNIDNGGGSPGGAGIFTQTGAGVSGNGGSSRFGGGGNPGSVSGGGYTQAVGYGSGGAGAAVAASTAAQPGGAGGTGIVIVWEYA